MADPKEEQFLDDVESAEADYADVEIDDGAMEVDSLRAERDEFRDKYMRALAEADNARKRAAKDRQEAQAYGGTRIARDLLPVYDNLNRALLAAKEDDSAASTALVEGVELTLKELLNVFDRHGVSRLTPEIGDKFDPKQHEAMFEAPVPGTTAGEIIQVSAEGFMLHDRLLRPAQVGVSSTPAAK
ncbi:nucleotide exchange factor GrpE [Sagittula salina]|uniref:Protein GrpE n=1 Tax=Sagittula salina TaxID=2820268 RepID=A0A940S1P1_9RHOB|nr:nucleotide exchange factor GrpE [Sagittula salina]MBP0483306.1 nucleotide exchange factor GrpE [Sagittula salina]